MKYIIHNNLLKGLSLSQPEKYIIVRMCPFQHCYVFTVQSKNMFIQELAYFFSSNGLL